MALMGYCIRTNLQRGGIEKMKTGGEGRNTGQVEVIDVGAIVQEQVQDFQLGMSL